MIAGVVAAGFTKRLTYRIDQQFAKTSNWEFDD